MKKMVSKLAIATLTATMAISSMMSISASANDGMTKEQADAAAAFANAVADGLATDITDPINGYDPTVDGYVTEPAEVYDSTAETSVNIFAQGNWYSLGMGGVVNYYFNPVSATGTRTNVDSGITDYFTYDFSGNRIVFYYGNYSAAATVSYSGYDIVLSWDDGKVETISTVYPGIDIEPAVTTVTTVATTDNSRYNQIMLAKGTWYAASASGARTYNFDLIEAVGSMTDFDGIAKGFDYSFDGSDLWLHFTDAAKGEHAAVIYNADGTISLSWASGLYETLTYSGNAKPDAPVTTTAVAAPVTTPVVTSTTPNTTVTTTTTTEVKSTAAATSANKTVTTSATQAAKKAPATNESPKTGDKLPFIAIGVAALAAVTGLLTFKKSPRK